MSDPGPSAAPASPTGNSESPPPARPPRSTRGRWKIGAGILAIALAAQAILAFQWWEDPTHFKMSFLFVWPAALFALLNWWTFFSGWPARVRYGSTGLALLVVIAFLCIFRLERFDGDMTPTRLALRWSPSAEQKAREYLEQADTAAAAGPADAVVEPLTADNRDWPGFRGPARRGEIRGAGLRTDWAVRPPRELWRHPVGRAWSSFAVVGDFAFTQEQRDDSEAVVAYRMSDGEQLWVHLDQAQFASVAAQGGAGPRATPQFHEGKLYTLGATGILNCLDARSGKVAWSTNILGDAGSDGQPAANLQWGTSGSPLVVGQLVVVIPGGVNGKSVVAYDRHSGKKVWSGGIRPATYAGPTVTTLCGEEVLLAPLGTGLAGHSLVDGRELWFFPWENATKVCGATPVALDEESVLYGIGYGVGTVRLRVKRSGQNWSVQKSWQSNRFRPKFNDFVIHDGHAYGLDDGTLTCLAVDSGTIKWKSGRYGYGQVLLVDELLLIVSEKGTVSLLPAQPVKPQELANFAALDEEGITWNQPVLVRGRLLVRNANEAACFDLE